MTKLSTKKININDYSKENIADIAKLARSLNPLMDDLERIMRKGISVEDNLPFQYISFDCEVDASGVPKTVIKLNTSLTTTIKGNLIVNITSLTSTPTSTPFILTEISGSMIEIKKIFGLPSNTKFNITILVVT